MRDIYRTAERVVAWIGDESEDSYRAMMFLKEMAMAKKRDSRCSWINGVRQGSDTSSECGDGAWERAQTLDEEGQESDVTDESVSSSGDHLFASSNNVVRFTSPATRRQMHARISGSRREANGRTRC